MILPTIFLISLAVDASLGDAKTSKIDCNAYGIVQYRLTFTGDWSEDIFPKQYPKFRPHAQWSKLFGRSHNEDYELWSLGTVATSSFKQFMQSGSTDHFDKRETQGFNGILDSFVGPPINSGVGDTSVDFFASSTHNMVSAIIKIIPSPDWFVGVNSLELCVNGSWLQELSLTMQPNDAGTDRGFTFTSPKWESRPRQAMYQITSQFPNHRASSFHYPVLDQLPPIGTIQLQLLTTNKEHKTHSRVSHLREVATESDEADPERRQEEMEEQQIIHGEPLSAGGSNLKPRAPARSVKKLPPLILRQQTVPATTPTTTTATATTTVAPTTIRTTTTIATSGVRTSTRTEPKRQPLKQHQPRQFERLTTRTDEKSMKIDTNRLPADQSQPRVPTIRKPKSSTHHHHHHSHNGRHGRWQNQSQPGQDQQQQPTKPDTTQQRNRQYYQQQQQRYQEQLLQQQKNLPITQHCEVSEWGSWSPCSKTCGIGAQKRYRKVTQIPKNGRSCPPLDQEKWCGSMRTCRDNKKMFSWLQTDKNKAVNRG